MPLKKKIENTDLKFNLLIETRLVAFFEYVPEKQNVPAWVRTRDLLCVRQT